MGGTWRYSGDLWDVTVTRADLLVQLNGRRNWGRWGNEDQLGAINLVTPEAVLRGCETVTLGLRLSLARDVPTAPGLGNPKPAHHMLATRVSSGGGGVSLDHCAMDVHGHSSTHIDALCHLWDDEGMWGGKDPASGFEGGSAKWGDVSQWSAGIITRGLLLDVPASRGDDSIVSGGPVHGAELEKILTTSGHDLVPGDALAVYGGRDVWERDHPAWMHEDHRPGLHMSCLEFLRDHDVSVLCWDFHDFTPCASEYGLPYGVHSALYRFGIALVDNCHFTDLVTNCRREKKYQFMLTIAPLRLVGGTGSPVNPIAVL